MTKESGTRVLASDLTVVGRLSSRPTQHGESLAFEDPNRRAPVRGSVRGRGISFRSTPLCAQAQVPLLIG